MPHLAQYIAPDRRTHSHKGLTITLEDNGETLLTGPVVDQAVLFGLLRKARDLGLPLLSINRVEPDHLDVADQ